MSEASRPSLSVSALFAERDARRRREQEAEEHLKQKHDEELAAFRQRLENFQLTDAYIETVIDRIKRAFERGETELMLTSFPSSFCTDNGRAINNPGAPPINEPDEKQKAAQSDEPEWLATLPKGARPIYEYWKSRLQPGGFGFTARIINYPGGVPGDVGLYFSWPKSAAERPS
jgi:hypothetical protein